MKSTQLIRLTGDNGHTDVTFDDFMDKYAAGTNRTYFMRKLEQGEVVTELDWYCGYKTAQLVK